MYPFNFVLYLNPPWEDDSYYVIAKKVVDDTGIVMFREYCRIINRGRHSLERASSLVNFLNGNNYEGPTEYDVPF